MSKFISNFVFNFWGVIYLALRGLSSLEASENLFGIVEW